MLRKGEFMNSEYVASVNSVFFYLLVALVLAFITVMCFVFLVKSYRAGIAIGMDRKVLKKAIISSATFTLLPSISILLGVIALSGTLGVPLSWLRLSVIGALQYELNVAEIAAQRVGLSGLRLSAHGQGTDRLAPLRGLRLLRRDLPSACWPPGRSSSGCPC